jgi:hypothetical protein
VIELQECPVLVPEVPQVCVRDEKEIERFNYQQRLLQDVQANMTKLSYIVENQKEELSAAVVKSNYLMSELTAAKAYQAQLVSALDSYRNLGDTIQELQAKWMEHSPAIAQLNDRYQGLLNSTSLVNSTIAVAKHLQAQNHVLNAKLNQSVSHVSGLHTSYSSHLSHMESQLKDVSRTCDQGHIDEQISHRLNELLKNESFIRKTNDRPVVSNKSLPWVDYASVRLGGQVVSTMTSPTYFPINMHLHTFKYLSALNVPINSIIPALNRFYNFIGVDVGVGKPKDAISEDMTIGSCWPLQGSNGIITIKLKHPVYITSITIDHIPK